MTNNVDNNQLQPLCKVLTRAIHPAQASMYQEPLHEWVSIQQHLSVYSSSYCTASGRYGLRYHDEVEYLIT